MSTNAQLQADKLWAEEQTSQQHAITVWEPHHVFMARLNQAEIDRELSQLRDLKRRRFTTPKEL